MEWKWTKGEPYERSRRNKYLEKSTEGENNIDIETAAYSSALNHDENTWEMLNNSIATANHDFNDFHSGFKLSNKREELDHKISDRELVQQIGFNPFLGETNYIDDISIRDKFLKPLNTTQDRIKPKNEELN